MAPQVRDDAELLEVFGREYAVDILAATDEPTTVGELHESLEIPKATCYRRVETLEQLGLLAEVEDQDGVGRETVYQRTIDGATFNFQESLTAELQPEGGTRSLTRVWKRLLNRD